MDAAPYTVIYSSLHDAACFTALLLEVVEKPGLLYHFFVWRISLLLFRGVFRKQNHHRPSRGT
jgi:hypothetical protein